MPTKIIIGTTGFSDLPEPETLNHYFDNFVGLILSSDENMTKKKLRLFLVQTCKVQKDEN